MGYGAEVPVYVQLSSVDSTALSDDIRSEDVIVSVDDMVLLMTSAADRT